MEPFGQGCESLDAVRATGFRARRGATAVGAFRAVEAQTTRRAYVHEFVHDPRRIGGWRGLVSISLTLGVSCGRKEGVRKKIRRRAWRPGAAHNLESGSTRF